ncbi:MAG: LysM peptidoglycan-binding domain-containing protein [Clostridium sp.]|nr:LysM peptidoglycan-binding domain-containing protein [Clostridium sp.]
MKLLFRYILSAWAFLFVVVSADAQESTFTHTIQKGETVYSIAKVYAVGVDDIYALNPEARQGIRAGAILRLPQKTKTGVGRYHTIASGETLYRLTQKYGVSAERICAANPGLTADNFRTGQVIIIPDVSAGVTVSQPVATTVPVADARPQGQLQSGCRDMHKVKRRETIYSIAREYGITEEELRRANAEMSSPDYKLKKGTFVCIPYPAPKTGIQEQPANDELLPRPVGIRRMRHLRMGVLLPFQSDESKGARMVEYYRGLLLAVDSLKQQGISVESYAFDSGKTAADMKKLLQKEELTKLDIVFGPLYADQTAPVASFCKEHRIKCVVPFTSQSDALYSSPSLYVINATKEVQHEEVTEMMKTLFPTHQIVLMDTGETDENGRNLTAGIRASLAPDGARISSVSLSSDDAAWQKAFSSDRKNLIVMNSSSIKALNQLFPKLKRFSQEHATYTFSLLGYPEWQTYTSSHLDNFYAFDTYVYSPFYRKPLSEACRQLESKYMYWFKSPMISSYPRFGLLGFDTGYFFLKGLADYGKEAFDECLDQMQSPDYQQSFCFRRVSNWGGFVNRKIKFIHYMPQQSVDLIDLSK